MLIKEIEISKIVPNPNQPRKHFDEESLNELANSILNDGLQEPILVRPTGNDMYEIVQGERRYRAHLIAKLETIQAKIRDLNDEDAFHLSVIENIQREQLTPIEEAQTFLRYTQLGMTHEEIAKKISKTRDYVTSKLRLLKLSEGVQNMIIKGLIKEGHAKQLLRLKPILERICTESYSIVKQDLFELFQSKFSTYFWSKESISVTDVKKWVDEWYYALVFSSIRQSLNFGSALMYTKRERLPFGLSIDMFCYMYGNNFENLTSEDLDFAAEFEKDLLKHSYDKKFRKWSIDRFYDSIRNKENPIDQETAIEWIQPSNYRFVNLFDSLRNERRNEHGELAIIYSSDHYHNLINEINSNNELWTDFFALMYGIYSNHSDAHFLPQTIKEFYEADEFIRERGWTVNDLLFGDFSHSSKEDLLRVRLLIEQCHRIKDSEGQPRMTNQQLAEMLVVNFNTGNDVSFRTCIRYSRVSTFY
ncbi:ParB/RepB/Spo0J family partition protein [Gordoniibacillus kamchatkensis]|uniref:ParB/RepB/Spo0J family partition protein n=1 Tax=Gordoniibacillus kamchatkensis TaxID=1590651 RepID=UPI000698FBAD|nr:ParB/RepB/Spo0J family partition protein [Paenibacillus sp. VKM B-2647]